MIGYGRSARPWRVVILVSVVMGVAILCVSNAWRLRTTSLSNGEQWNNAGSRGRIAREMVEDRRLIGMPQEDVIRTLGVPDKTYDADARWQMGWTVGKRTSSAPFMFPYNEYLVVRVVNGRVQEAGIVNSD